MSVNRNDTVPLGRTRGLIRPIIAQHTTNRVRPLTPGRLTAHPPAHQARRAPGTRSVVKGGWAVWTTASGDPSPAVARATRLVRVGRPDGVAVGVLLEERQHLPRPADAGPERFEALEAVVVGDQPAQLGRPAAHHAASR